MKLKKSVNKRNWEKSLLYLNIKLEVKSCYFFPFYFVKNYPNMTAMDLTFSKKGRHKVRCI